MVKKKHGSGAGQGDGEHPEEEEEEAGRASTHQVPNVLL